MKYSLTLLLLFTIPLISMEAPPQVLQQKIAAAQLHNRTHCPLAGLPKDVQDYIATYLEFNDRESDEEFVRNALIDIQMKHDGSHTLGLPIRGLSDEMRTKYAGRKTPAIMVHGKPCIYDLALCPPPKAEQAFIALLKPHESPEMYVSSFPSVCVQFSRDRSKVLMQRTIINMRTYFFIYDTRENKTIYAESHLPPFEIFFYKLLAVSNDGKIFSILKVKGSPRPHSYGIVRGEMYYAIDDDTIEIPTVNTVEFNKQSTLIYDKKKGMHFPFCSEQEHKERSKKTLALYLHQKGICKPFNYRQESA